MIYKRIAILFITVSFLVTGCESPALYNQTENNAADVFQKAKDARQQSNNAGTLQGPLKINQGMYVDRRPISLDREPSWLKNTIIIRGNDLPFSYFNRTIIGNGHLLADYGAGLDPTGKISMFYTGTIQGALDELASKTGYAYHISGNHIYWDAYINKTFDIAFMPGTTDYLLGDSAGGGGGASAGGGGGSSGATSGGVTSGQGQGSSLKGASLSIWKDLEEAIKAMLSPNGKVMVSQATTTVTVRDTPATIALVARYIRNLNHNLSKQVLVKVQILQVTLNSDFNYGINWSIIQGAFGGSNVVLNANYGTPVSITPLTGATIPSGGLQIMPNRGTGFTILINALKEQGKVAIVTEPRVVCLNNQVSVINIVQKLGYAASVSSTALAGGTGSNGSSVTSSITPGTVVTGLILYILPKILGNKIYLDVNADLSSLVQLQTFTSGEGGSSPASIQVPETTEKEFNQRSVIGSGDTLILSGLRQVTNQTGAMQFLDSQALGGKAATQNDQETIVLITPIILNGSA
jgi:type IVB pilus formation R64 PilN family outer membrane protein